MHAMLFNRICCSIVLFFLAQAYAETGMCLVVCQTLPRQGCFFYGDIRRIDMRDNQIVNTTSPIGFGCFPRFSPDGSRFVYKYQTTLTIATVNGNTLRSWDCGVIDPDAHLSWTNTGIYVGTLGKFVKYDTLGNYLWEKYFEDCNWGFVGQNDSLAAGIHICCYPVIFDMIKGTSLPVTDLIGCSACPSPSGKMVSNNLWDPDPHQNFRVLDKSGKQIMFFKLQETLGIPEDYFSNVMTWSGNGENWMILPVGQAIPGEVDITRNTSPWIFNVITREAHQFANRTNDFWQPHDYYSGWAPITTPSSIELSTQSIHFYADSGGPTPVSKTITLFTPNGELTDLSFSGVPSWLTIKMESTTGKTIRVNHNVHPANLTCGTYAAPIKVNTSQMLEKTYTVEMTIVPSTTQHTFTTLKVTPSEVTLSPGAVAAFNTTCTDQYGRILPSSRIRWNTVSGGSIDSLGTFTAGAKLGGPHMIIATAVDSSITLRDTALLTISTQSTIHRKINCGNNAYDLPGWERDDAFVSGGSDIILSTPEYSDYIGPRAPDKIYRSLRGGSAHSYSFTNLTPSNYTVRIHFSNAGKDLRNANYYLQGINILRNASLLWVINTPQQSIALDFITTVGTDEKLVLQCDSGASEAGLEIIQSIRTPIAVISPSGGENLIAGETALITWTVDSTLINNVFISLSIDNGRSWCPLTDHTIKAALDPDQWQHFSWTVPFTLCDISSTSSQCLIKVASYDGASAISPIPFSISLNSSIKKFSSYKSTSQKIQVGTNLWIDLVDNRTTCLFRLDGTLLGKWNGRQCLKSPVNLTKGIYILRHYSANKYLQRNVMIMK